MLRVNIVSPVEEQRINALELSEDTTVDSLRGILAHRYGVANDPAVVRLLASGRLLQNGRTVGSYGIRDGSSIHVIARAGGSSSGSNTFHSSASATGGEGGGANLNFGGVDFAQLGSALPGLLGTLASQTYSDNNADRSRLLANAANFLNALSGTGAQAQQQQNADNTTAASQSATGSNSGGAAPPAANPTAEAASRFLSNPAVAGFFGFMTSMTSTAPTGSSPQATSANPNQGGAQNSNSGGAAGVNINHGGFGLQFTAPFSITPPPPARETMPLHGPFFVQHLFTEAKRSGVDITAAGMGFLMGNVMSLQPLRAPFYAASQAYATEQRSVVFPSSSPFAERRTISLACSEGERAYAAMLSDVRVQDFLRVKGGIHSSTQLDTLHCEVRNFFKAVYLRLMRLTKMPARDMDDSQWTTALRGFVVFHVGLFLDREPRWFSEGGADAATAFLSDALVAELQKQQPNNWQTTAAMVPALVPQLARSWHQEYTDRLRDARNDYECFWSYPTNKDLSISDLDEAPPAAEANEGGRAAQASAPGNDDLYDDDDEAFARALVEELMHDGDGDNRSQNPSVKSKDEALREAMAEWTEAAGLRASVTEQLEAALMLSQRSAGDEREGAADAPLSPSSTPASSLWTELSWKRRD